MFLVCWLSKSLQFFHRVCNLYPEITKQPWLLTFGSRWCHRFELVFLASACIELLSNPYCASGPFFRGLHSSYSSQVQMCNVPSCYDVPRWTRRTGTLADRIWEVVDRALCIWSKLLSRGAWVPWAGKLYHTSHAQTTLCPTLADQTLSTCFSLP